LIVSAFRANIRHTKKEVVIMTREEFKRELKYRLALSIAQNMLKQGLIDDVQYKLMDIHLAQHFQPFFGYLAA